MCHPIGCFDQLLQYHSLYGVMGFHSDCPLEPEHWLEKFECTLQTYIWTDFFSCKNAEPLACVWYGYSYLENSLSQGWLNIIASFPVAGNVSVKSVIATPHAQRRQHARVAVGAVRGVSDRMMIHPFLAVLYCSPSCLTLSGSKVKVSHRLDGAQAYFYSYYRTRKTRRTRTKIS